MDKSGTGEGHLVIFNRKKEKSWEEKIYHKTEKVSGKSIEVWGM
ncbi:MAG: hypothetical protein V4489_03890 [Chlamydiota bacterium]